MTEQPEETVEETVVEETEVEVPPWIEPTEQPDEPQADDKPGALNAIINNPVWLAVAFLTLIVIALIVFA